MATLDLSTAETLSFVDAAILRRAKRVLEVGCGNGALAAAMLRAGREVVAIDANAKAIEAARRLGVDARLARFPEFEGLNEPLGAPFDAVLFTRSLHHVHPLRRAIERTESLLVPGGMLVVEDWGWEEMDAKTAAWAYGLFGALRAAGCAPEDEFVCGAGEGPVAAWIREHTREHELHPGAAVLAAVRDRFEILGIVRCPYFFRYPCRYLEGDPRSGPLARAILDAERRLIALGAILPLGLRIVARAPAEKRP